MFRRHVGVGVAALFSITFRVHAQSDTQGVPVHLEYRKQMEAVENIAPLNKGLFGDNLSLYDGRTYFQTADINIPGNDRLAVQLSRRISIDLRPPSEFPYDDRLLGAGNWDVDAPYVSATYPQQVSWGCSQGVIPSMEDTGFYQSQYWHGITVHVPGEDDRSLLSASSPSVPRPSGSAAYRFSTNKRDALDCIPMQNGTIGGGFRMTTASGIKYYFDVAVTRIDATLQRKELVRTLHVEPGGTDEHFETSDHMVYEGVVEKTFYLHRNKYYILASKIEDRFGNSVQFQYDGNGHPVRIWSNDGREILLAYSDGRLTTAAAYGKTWQYQYDGSGKLSVVVLPDTSRWQYSYSDDLMSPYTPPDYENLETVECRGFQAMIDENYTLTAMHPSGAVGTFEFVNKRHFRSGVHAGECERKLGTSTDGYQDSYRLLVPYYFDVMSLARKTISGPGLAQPMVWSYDYSGYAMLWGRMNEPFVYPCATCTQAKDVTVTNPDATKEKHRFGMEYRYNDGRLLQSDTLRTDGTVIRSEINEYLADSAMQLQPFYGQYGSVLGVSADPTSPNIRPIVRHDIKQDGVTFRSVVNSFDGYARPTQVTKTSTPSP